MGLAAAKNKRKLGNDPNNTKWSRNTDSFGQKILRAQGWQPGDYLGAKDAPHAEWHTEANTSHIRVVLKDDTLGLGAKRNNGDECTGLDAFQHLLGRLNGKSDETLDAERKVREDLKLSQYVERKLGTIRFVKGGWLVGDQVKETPEEETPKEPAEATKAEEPAASEPKKRKANHESDQEDEKARKKEKKSKKRKTESEAEANGQSSKEKKDSKKSKKRRTESGETDEGTPAVSTASESDQADSSSEAKKAKKAKKEKKEKKKEKKDKTERGEKKDKKEKKEKSKKNKTRSKPETETNDRIPDAAALGATPVESGTTTPNGSGYSTPISTSTSTRYLARSRFIAQKRMALTDSAALNQIFMIKS
ncbi:protein PXR1 [Staphylotrichum tortipilum]|uniref:PinX1-related protein 1 n=1 Tax=Staphylotrichum tortipilum TaxID=2831512 RepID=A0AAN6MDI5_9PEZI|nr:protein PXR1 [Staphylotrichum longicolle]